MLTPRAVDIGYLPPRGAAIEREAGHVPEELSAGAGYASEVNLERLNRHAASTHGSGQLDRSDGDPLAVGLACTADNGCASGYRLRKLVAEPVIGDQPRSRVPATAVARTRTGPRRMEPNVNRPRPDQAGGGGLTAASVVIVYTSVQ